MRLLLISLVAFISSYREHNAFRSPCHMVSPPHDVSIVDSDAHVTVGSF